LSQSLQWKTILNIFLLSAKFFVITCALSKKIQIFISVT
jgi:hypothetical protein